jgi:hypothetical protein
MPLRLCRFTLTNGKTLMVHPDHVKAIFEDERAKSIVLDLGNAQRFTITGEIDQVAKEIERAFG